MNSKDCKQIIDSYHPHKGFFDLSNKPNNLTLVEYAKIINVQNFLAAENEKADYLKKWKPLEWERLKDMSGSLQQLIFEYWSPLPDREGE